MRSIWNAIAVLLIFFILAACSEEETETEEASGEATVEVAEAEIGDIVIERKVYGRTEPDSTTPLMVETPGEVDSLEKQEGEAVEEDDLVATLTTPAGEEEVRAPEKGHLAELQAREGEAVNPDEPFAIIADLTAMRISFSVTSQIRSLLSVGDTLEALIEGEEYEAEILQMNVLPDDTGLYPVEAIIRESENDILPGEVAELIVPETRISEELIVPTAAVIQEDGTSYIFVVREGSAEKVEVSVNETQTDKSAVEGDIEAGERAVISGQLSLDDGDKVKVGEGE